MNKFLVASAAVLALGGTAMAQDTPTNNFPYEHFQLFEGGNADQPTTVNVNKRAVVYDRAITNSAAPDGYDINTSRNYSGR